MTKRVTAPSGYRKFMAKVSTKDKAKIKALAAKKVKQSVIAKLYHTRKENVGHYLRTIKVGKRRVKGGFWDVVADIRKASHKDPKKRITHKEATKVTKDLPRFKKPRTERQKAHLRAIIGKRKRRGAKDRDRWTDYGKAKAQAKDKYDISNEDFELMAEEAESMTGDTPK